MGLKEEKERNERLEAQLKKQEVERQEDRETIQRLYQQVSTLSIQLGQLLVQTGATEESHVQTGKVSAAVLAVEKKVKVAASAQVAPQAKQKAKPNQSSSSKDCPPEKPENPNNGVWVSVDNKKKKTQEPVKVLGEDMLNVLHWSVL